jgi:hypothetical protein
MIIPRDKFLAVATSTNDRETIAEALDEHRNALLEALASTAEMAGLWGSVLGHEAWENQVVRDVYNDVAESIRGWKV